MVLRLGWQGRPPTPLLADTITRFKLDQEPRNRRRCTSTGRIGQRIATAPALGAGMGSPVSARIPQDYRKAPWSKSSTVRESTSIGPSTLTRRCNCSSDWTTNRGSTNSMCDSTGAYEGLYLRLGPAPRHRCPGTALSAAPCPTGRKACASRYSTGQSGPCPRRRCGPLDSMDCRRLIKVGERAIDTLRWRLPMARV